MFYFVITLLTNISIAGTDSYQADVQNYKFEKEWNTAPVIYVCEKNDIKISDVSHGRDFWNQKLNNNILKNIKWTKDCDKPKKNSIMIKRGKTESDEWAYALTSTKSGQKTITRSLIVISEEVQNKDFLKEIITHELGHSIGIKHCDECKNNDIMSK